MDSFQRGGLIFPVRDESPPGEGAVHAEPVVLLHGFPQDAGSFDRVTPALHARGFRTLVPTQRGYAASARPTSRRAYSTTETTADLVALLDAAGVDRAHVVGHDWGGAPAWAIGAWHPDRVASLTVLSTPHPGAMAASFVSSLQGLRSWYMGFFQLPAVPELAAGKTLSNTLASSGLPPEFVARYTAAMAEPGALTGALNWYRGMPFSARPAVGRITVPTSYVWGRTDFALGRAAAERTRGWVDGQYTFVELDAGHWLPETRPDEVAAAIVEQAAAA